VSSVTRAFPVFGTDEKEKGTDIFVQRKRGKRGGGGRIVLFLSPPVHDGDLAREKKKGPKHRSKILRPVYSRRIWGRGGKKKEKKMKSPTYMEKRPFPGRAGEREKKEKKKPGGSFITSLDERSREGGGKKKKKGGKRGRAAAHFREIAIGEKRKKEGGGFNTGQSAPLPFLSLSPSRCPGGPGKGGKEKKKKKKGRVEDLPELPHPAQEGKRKKEGKLSCRSADS